MQAYVDCRETKAPPDQAKDRTRSKVRLQHGKPAILVNERLKRRVSEVD